MFDFFFRRSAKQSGTTATVATARPAVDRPDPGQAKQAAIEQAARFANDEAGAVEFILQCPIADARYAAAGHVRSRELLERTLKGVRNSDRRVARLMQSRLDALQREQRDAERAAHCLQQAGQLARQPFLIANQVADLDREWQAIANLPEATRVAFDAIREQLRLCLEAQADLQRAVRDLVGHMRLLAADAPSMTADEVAGALDRMSADMSRLLASDHAASLPQQLAAEFRLHDGQVRRMLADTAARNTAIDARAAALSDWEQASPASLNRADLTRAWRALPVLNDEEAAAGFERGFAQLTAAIDPPRRQPAPPAAQSPAVNIATSADSGQFAEVVGQLEQALHDGSLQAAAEADRVLRTFDLHALRAEAALLARLATARAELHRLQAWARWGGNISREELLKAAQALPAEEWPPQELAKRVGSLRARWKALDGSAGHAHREIWERFDAACTTAYAPAAAYFEQRAGERSANLQAGRQLIDEVRSFAASIEWTGSIAPLDWKAIAHFGVRMQQAWRQLGPIDRKEKKLLDRDFNVAMQTVLEPLAAERQAEIGRRERLIEEVEALDMQQRNATDAVRALQERWQQQSKLLPLERRDEQALWQRFRTACDAAFAVR